MARKKRSETSKAQQRWPAALIDPPPSLQVWIRYRADHEMLADQPDIRQWMVRADKVVARKRRERAS
jgi:hypothetical protein